MKINYTNNNSKIVVNHNSRNKYDNKHFSTYYEQLSIKIKSKSPKPDSNISRRRGDHINNPNFQTINECHSDNDINT